MIAALAMLLCCGISAFAQYSYTSSSISATSTTVYASTYVELDYASADYYTLELWSELDQNCNVSCDYNTSGVAGGWRLWIEPRFMVRFNTFGLYLFHGVG
jgi:hypothetical protein